MGNLSSRPITPAHKVPKDRVDEAQITEDGAIVFSLCDNGTKYILEKSELIRLLRKYKDKQ